MAAPQENGRPLPQDILKNPDVTRFARVLVKKPDDPSTPWKETVPRIGKSTGRASQFTNVEETRNLSPEEKARLLGVMRTIFVERLKKDGLGHIASHMMETAGIEPEPSETSSMS